MLAIDSPSVRPDVAMSQVPVPPPAALGGRYTLERELGRGGAATVYLAADRKHRRRVAVKVLRPEIAATIGTERFLREIEIVAGLTHPHILPLHDSGESDGVVYYVMPYVEGESLRDRLRREGQLPVDEALRIARDVCAALAHAHGHGIVHRDIKPENILLEGDEAVVADFGIARALDVAAFEPLSEPGLVVGTPVYMSPEQASGSALDGRSDLYSLGCVLYEMLLGEPPFTGGTAQVIVARHRTEPPRPLRGLRPTVPPEVEAAVLATLAKAPADRPRTALELVRLLSPPASGEVGVVHAGAPTGVPAPTATAGASRPRRWWRRLVGAMGLGAAVLASMLLGARALDRSPPTATAAALDPGLYAVLPFAHRAGADAPVLSGDACESLLYQALSRWTGMRLVDPLWVADARARRGHADGLAAALAVARERGARWFLTGDVRLHRDTVRIRGALYDAARDGATVREATVAVRPDLSDAEERFEELAQSLITGASSVGGVAAGTALGTRSVPAWRAFERGTVALEQWELAAAETAFAEAVRLDPAYPQPRYWLAQTRAWRGDAPAAWRGEVAEALRRSALLAPAERQRAEALLALGDERFTNACGRYAELVRADSFDFLAWYGLAECHRRDRVVEPDSSSPSGWRFRADYQTALRAYSRALAIVPSVHTMFRGDAFAQLTSLLLSEPNVFRLGYSSGPDTLWFGAWPALAAKDSVVLVPWPLDELLAGRPGTRSPTHADAVAHTRELLRSISAVWTRAYPQSADAWEAQAYALEAVAALGPLAPGHEGGSALGAVRTAVPLAHDAAQLLRLGAAEVRLLVKLERFGEAHDAAVRLLDAGPPPDPESAEMLASVAALVGRGAQVAAWSNVAASRYVVLGPDGAPFDAPLPVKVAVVRLLVAAALGAPPESLRMAHLRARRVIDSYYEANVRVEAYQALLARPERLAFAEAQVLPVARPERDADYIGQMQWDLAAGDTAAVRAAFSRQRELRASSRLRPGDIVPEGLLLEAQLLLAIGDTGAAVALLDPPLEALPSLGSELLLEVPQAAALVRVMALRARLAAARREDETARRWDQAVAELHGVGAMDRRSGR
jgi:tRNA A-37 threonylcarbamoyl transferase component Bud32/tetratricopeptide (TPR) repeat protein